MFSKAPWSSNSPREQGKSEDGASLTTVLSTAEHRIALTILIGDCTEAMRQGILDTFDAQQTGAKLNKATSLDDGQLASTIDELEGEVPDIDREKAAQALARRQAEVNDPNMQELKAAALRYFDDWHASVIQRVGAVINARDQPESAGQHSSETSTAQPSSSVQDTRPAHYDEKVEIAMREIYPPINNPLQNLPESQRALILHSVLLLLLSLEHYQAPSRILLLRLTTSLRLPLYLTTSDERKIARGLLAAAENLNADNVTKEKAEENQTSRRWKVGIAAVAGAALIGVTGGLAAPLLAAGVGSVMGGLGLGATAAAGYLGSLAGSAVLVGGLFGAYGGRMTSKMMDKYAREVEDFAFVPLNSQHSRKAEIENHRLRVAIGISGWLTEKKEVYEPWRVLGTGIESFALSYELEALMGMGVSMTSFVTSYAWSYAKKEIIKRTIFATLSAALWPLGLLKMGRVLDNPFSVGNFRAIKAGEVLADAIINKAQGERPVTLVGYSLGAKVIFTCLQKLAERKAFGLVESAILIGTPASSSSADWRKIRSVVSGRVVNVYSERDYILGFLYRGQSIQLGVAGLQAIKNVPGIENLDVSDIASGHTSYRFLTGTILDKIGFEDINAEQLELERAALREQEAAEERKRAENEQKEKEKGLLGLGKESTHADGETVDESTLFDLEKEIEERKPSGFAAGGRPQAAQSFGQAARSDHLENQLVDLSIQEPSNALPSEENLGQQGSAGSHGDSEKPHVL